MIVLELFAKDTDALMEIINTATIVVVDMLSELANAHLVEQS